MKLARLFSVMFLTIISSLAGAEKAYEVKVPDTLDLAERGRLALNCLTSCSDPNDYYNHYFATRITAVPAYMDHVDVSVFICCHPKWLEAIPEMRAMSGSDQNLEEEKKIIGAAVSMLDPDDGLLYLPPADLNEKPWYKRGNYDVITEPVTSPFGDARMMLAMMAYYQQERDPRWLTRLQKAARGLAKTAIDKGDYAYYPEGKSVMEFAYLKKSGYAIEGEAQGEHEGGEGTVLAYQGGQIRALSRWYKMSGDKEALELARKVSRYVMMEKFWQPKGTTSYTHPADHAHVEGHHHGTAIALRGLLEYAHAANDPRVLDFVRDGYEYARTRGIARVGNFGDLGWKPQTEVCTIADMVALPIRLSDYGAGDYWEDVDTVVRNHLVESQLVDIDLMREVGKAAAEHPEAFKEYKFRLGRGPEVWRGWDRVGKNSTSDRVLERNVGNFTAFMLPNAMPYPGTGGCCTGNAAQALYYAWEAITRCDRDGNASVNLLLNRAAPWLDVESHLPYEGKVVIRNKTAKRLSVRIPRFADRSKIHVDIDGKTAKPFFAGNFLVLDRIKKKDVIAITFPQTLEKVKLTMPFDKTYEFTFKGNTVVDISPRDTNPTSYPIYQRDKYKQNKAPLASKQVFVSNNILTW